MSHLPYISGVGKVVENQPAKDAEKYVNDKIESDQSQQPSDQINKASNQNTQLSDPLPGTQNPDLVHKTRKYISGMENKNAQGADHYIDGTSGTDTNQPTQGEKFVSNLYKGAESYVEGKAGMNQPSQQNQR